MNPLLLHFFGLKETDVQHVTSASLQFRNAEAAGWLVFVAMLLAAFVWWSYFRMEAHRALSPARKRLLAALRLTLLGLIVLLLLRPVFALEIEAPIRRTILLLVDASKSMNLRDQRVDEADQKRAEIALGAIDSLSQLIDPAQAAKAKQMSRAELLKAVLQNDHLRLLDNLKKDFNVETYLFGQAAAPADGPGWLVDYRPDSDTTAIGDAVGGVLERKRGQPLAAILLMTDGGNNSGASPVDAAQDAARDGVPIFAYGIGITTPRDIVVSHLSAPEIAFANDAVSVTVQVRGQGMTGQTGQLSLKLGGEEVASKAVAFTGADQIISLDFTPRTKGDFDLVAGIPPRDDEASKDNNSAHQRLRVIDDKIKVLYIERQPRWEFRYLQQVLLRDRRIHPSFVLTEADPGISQGVGTPYLAKFPDDKEQLFKYDILIFGDVDPKAFSAAQLDAVAEFVSKFGGASMFIAGRDFMPDAYRGTPVEKMLPVELAPFPVSAASAATTTRPIRLALTPLGAASQMLRLVPDEQANSQLWSGFPPIYWDASVARPKPAAQVLVEDPDPARASRFGRLPVLATQQYGVGQVFFLGTDDLWRWRRGEGVNQYPLLWGQIVQGAALAHLLGTSKKTQLSVDKEEHNVGDPVTVYARLYNDSFQPITDSQVQAAYSVQAGAGAPPGDKTELTLRAVPDQPGMFRGDFVALKAGRYSLATVNDPGATVEFTASQPQFELGDTAMNETLLRQMASASGGQFFREENLADLPAALKAKPETIHAARDLEIWSSPFYFLLMCLIAVTEWLLRKIWNLK
jgi:hypothetical protein